MPQLIEETNGSHQQQGSDYLGNRAAEMARLEKHLKGRLAAAAEHFNRDHKKGFQYLQVSAPGGSLRHIWGPAAV